MPTITIHKGGQAHTGEVRDGANLVVQAGIRQFPYPHLRYRCGMGKCGTCACRVLAGGEHLPEPNWKEKKLLGDERLAGGERLMCQLWLSRDLEISQTDKPVPVRTASSAAPGADQPCT
jgi:ferredoxin